MLFKKKARCNGASEQGESKIEEKGIYVLGSGCAKCNSLEENVKEALANPDSIFYTYQKLVNIRKENSWLVRADFELLDTAEKVFAYIRKDGDRRFLVVANLSNQRQEFAVEESITSVLIENTSVEAALATQTLAPWDAFCIELAN